MPAYPCSALALGTDFCASDDIEAAARRTDFVQRTSNITGKLLLALITFGSWSDAATTLGPLAAKATSGGQAVEGSPEAISQRLHTHALAFRQDMIRQALATVQALENVCEDGRFSFFTKVSRADSTGFALPDSLQELLPGSGGSAAKAGAKMHAVWDYKSRVFGPFALPPWNLPAQQYVDNVVALAHQDVLLIFDGGYFKVKALALLVDTGVYFLSRRNHQTQIFDAPVSPVQPLELARFLQTVQGNRIEQPIGLGATEQLACRLRAYRGAEPISNERRRIAQKTAKSKGYTPSPTHLELVSWNLLITKVPHTIGQTETIAKVYPGRWQRELIVTSGKRDLHVASIQITKADPTFCSLSGRLLLMVLT